MAVLRWYSYSSGCGLEGSPSWPCLSTFTNLPELDSNFLMICEQHFAELVTGLWLVIVHWALHAMHIFDYHSSLETISFHWTYNLNSLIYNPSVTCSPLGQLDLSLTSGYERGSDSVLFACCHFVPLSSCFEYCH